MPLPPALLKRLASRGLVNKDGEKRQRITANREEIIAEDYGEVEDPYNYEISKKPEENFWIERMKRRMAEGSNTGHKGCPNKYNIYHKCTLFCINRWADGVLEPNREYLKRRSRLIKKFPLPKNWLEVYDYGCGVHYYWNTTDDTVSWLPPNHPKSQITKSAATLRKEMEESLPPPEDDDSTELTAQEIQRIIQAPMPPSPPIKRSDSPHDEPTPPAPMQIIKKTKSRDLDKALRRGSRKNKLSKDSEPLDPMDPAAYSDIPRGKWSDGLSVESTKTGVDPTAAGALFQMRPYPSPGAVLHANAAAAATAERGIKSEEDEEIK